MVDRNHESRGLPAPALLLPFALTLLVLAACDPVHSDQKAALGDEAPGVGTGPTHRPGQPCLICHDGSFGNPSKFAVAGTVFQDTTSKTAASGVTVRMTGADGATREVQTNEVGNFYMQAKEWTPVYPMTVSLVYGQASTCMWTRTGRDGSCAGCHFDPAGSNSPGHVALKPDPTTYVGCPK